LSDQGRGSPLPDAEDLCRPPAPGHSQGNDRSLDRRGTGR
jgi:hypothetical protein